ncbi:class I SAM-dependent methyltransferase [Rhizobium sp. NXC24]|uniref:class I SAM-dependent methyltransferase n=1 Tax=Rhizobium sp. NXC24 TaxID=2048897 RepID=UPI000CDF535E|nr:class I SAM-dependent methyltransferase [Rhizobium sp. NXC24]AVA24079.1 tellurite resistance methyltransferase TehB-like protein [Rhizobium sp. NXC24]
MKNSERFWERGYLDPNVWTMGGPSLEVYEIEQQLPRNAMVVDLGCGEGRNALFLAFRGHTVTALEPSSSAVRKLRSVADEHSLSIDVIEGKIEDFVPDQRYDLALAHSSLHFVTKDVWVPLVNELRQRTNESGFHNFTSIIGTSRYPVPYECRHANSFDRGDLESLYADWQVLRSDFYAKWDSHPGIPTHVHAVEKFVSRKAGPHEALPFIKIDLSNSDALPCDLFEKIPLGIQVADVRPLCPPTTVNRIEMPGLNLTSPTELTRGYAVEEWFFGKHALQFTQGVLTGKYEYFTQPFSLQTVQRTSNGYEAQAISARKN